MCPWPHRIAPSNHELRTKEEMVGRLPEKTSETSYLVQQLVVRNRNLRKPPRSTSGLIRLLLDKEVEVPLALPVQTLHVGVHVARVHARRSRPVLFAPELLQVLSGHARTGRAGVVRAKAGAERPPVALAFLEVELGLEEGARLEVELVREGVVQRALEAGLVGVVGAFEGRRRAREEGGAVEDDGGAEEVRTLWAGFERWWW